MTGTAPRRSHSSAGRLLLFFLAGVLTLTGLAGKASAATWSTTQTRVGASDPETLTPVGAGGHIGAGQRPGEAIPQPSFAEGHGVHTFYVIPISPDGTRGPAVLVHNACGLVNLPSWKSIEIDMEHILPRHTASGKIYKQSGIKTKFPDKWSTSKIEQAIRDAYRRGEIVGTQGPKVLIRGTGKGERIEMWVNRKTRQIETAYPVG